MKKVLLCVEFLMLVLFCSVVYADTNLTIMPIDTINWGDSVLLESNGEYLLMDVTSAAKNKDYNNTEADDVLNFLIKNNVKKFDLYLSHYHYDHIGGYNKLTTIDKNINLMRYIISNVKKGGYKNYIYDIGTLYLPDPKICYDSNGTNCESYYENLIKDAESNGVNVVTLTTGSKFSLGNTNAEVLYVNTDAGIINSSNVKDENSLINNSSLVTMFTNGNTKFLSAGDIEQYTENKILELGIDVFADIYKLSHHGFQYSTLAISNTKKFIDNVKPKYSFFQYRITSKDIYDYIEDSINNVSFYSNLYTTQVNGNLKFVIENDEITPIVEKKYYSITINYIDKENNTKFDSKQYDFSYDFYGNEIPYHLYDYKKSFKGYSLSKDSDDIIESGVLSNNLIYNLYYEKNNYKLIVQHIDETGKILKEEINNYKYNTTYSTSADKNLLENYKLSSEPTNKEGTIDEDVTVIYRYIENKKEEILDENGESVDNPSNSDDDESIELPSEPEDDNLENKDELLENPETGIVSFYGILLIAMFIGIGFYYLIRRYDRFPMSK